MNRRARKLVLLSALGFVIAVDVVHAILNRIFHPFIGPVDGAMHIVLSAAPLVYFIACLWGCFQLAKWFSGTKFLSKNDYASLILLVVIVSELGFTLLTPARSGSSHYHRLFPDFLGGIILAMVTMIAGRELCRSRIGSAFVVWVVFFWFAGAMTVDLLWWTERTNRGVGPVWDIPVIGQLVIAISYIFIFGGHWVEECLYFPESIFKAGPLVQTAWYLALTISLALWLRWLTPNRRWLVSLALAASAVFLGWKAVEWSSFIAD
jgi:hypothetical protein